MKQLDTATTNITKHSQEARLQTTPIANFNHRMLNSRPTEWKRQKKKKKTTQKAQIWNLFQKPIQFSLAKKGFPNPEFSNTNFIKSYTWYQQIAPHKQIILHVEHAKHSEHSNKQKLPEIHFYTQKKTKYLLEIAKVRANPRN